MNMKKASYLAQPLANSAFFVQAKVGCQITQVSHLWVVMTRQKKTASLVNTDDERRGVRDPPTLSRRTSPPETTAIA